MVVFVYQCNIKHIIFCLVYATGSFCLTYDIWFKNVTIVETSKVLWYIFPYLQFFFHLQEALRLFPSVPLLGRELTEDCKFGKLFSFKRTVPHGLNTV